MWITLIIVAVIGVIANAARQNSDAKTINRLQQNQQRKNDFQYRYMHRDEFDNGATYDSNGRPIK